MVIKTAFKICILILSLALLSVLSACGELPPLFTSEGTYQVRALVNGHSLESCSIIRHDDKIVPYFAVSVVNDPDLTGLLVYLQNPQGVIIGETVLYTINPVEEKTQPAAQPETPQEEIKPEESKDASSKEGASSKEDEDSGKKGDNETTGQAAAELSKHITEKPALVDTKSAVKKYNTVIPIKSFDQEMPCFPLPKNMEIGQYRLVFEAIGSSDTLSLTEADIFYLGSVEFHLKDISMYLPGLSDTSLIQPGATVMLEAGLDFDSSLNPYVIWYNGKNIIREGNISEGAGNILWKAPEQPGFYSLRLEVLPYRLKRNLTGIFREITLPVSAKASQTGYFFGNGPDYPAKRPLAAGTAYAEKLAAAQIPLQADVRILTSTGKTENADKTTTAPVLPEYPELLRWFRFDGSLDEANSKPDRAFEAASKKTPQWAAVGQSYGLSAGPDDVYLLRPLRFFRQGQDQGGGIFLFHIRPVAEGTIFSAFFPLLASASDGVWMDMTARENAIILRLKTKRTSVELPVKTDYSGEQGLIPVFVEFYIRPYRFEAKISLGEELSLQSTAGEIKLSGALAGEGRIRLGVDKTAPGNTSGTKNESTLPNPAVSDTTAVSRAMPVETVQPESINDENIASSLDAAAVIIVNAVTTIWDEFAVLYSSTPLLPEEIFENLGTEDAQDEAPPVKTPAAAVETQKEFRASLPPEEKARPNSENTGAPHESEDPLSDIQAGNILMEQEPAETETGNEEAPLLISTP
ncbi:MAG: hypothetical protein LBU85_11155 [Treponema sp.]|jgi:hypothetical protein|nr:hypothetical protein [Treponema sp.]